MSFVELFLIAVGLSMDAFAVSVCKGLGMSKFRRHYALVVGLFFGGFQALMPLIGWFIGNQFEQYISHVDHWIVFLFLSLIGGKMLWDGVRGKDEDCARCETLRFKELLFLAVATSIDALTVGFTFSFLQVSILPAIALIFFITFSLSCAGVYIGYRFGAKYRAKAEMAGGSILILIGCKVLLEHLGILCL